MKLASGDQVQFPCWGVKIENWLHQISPDLHVACSRTPLHLESFSLLSSLPPSLPFIDFILSFQDKVLRVHHNHPALKDFIYSLIKKKFKNGDCNLDDEELP